MDSTVSVPYGTLVQTRPDLVTWTQPLCKPSPSRLRGIHLMGHFPYQGSSRVMLFTVQGEHLQCQSRVTCIWGKARSPRLTSRHSCSICTSSPELLNLCLQHGSEVLSSALRSLEQKKEPKQHPWVVHFMILSQGATQTSGVRARRSIMEATGTSRRNNISDPSVQKCCSRVLLEMRFPCLILTASSSTHGWTSPLMMHCDIYP